MLGSEFTSRSVIVVWLSEPTVRLVSGAWLLPKNAPVRASAKAPSMANTSFDGSLVIAVETPLSTRTPRMRPLRSVMTMIASVLADAATARRHSSPGG